MLGPCFLYRHYAQDGALLYVGISSQPTVRLEVHRSASPWFEQITTVKIEKFPNRKAALAAEHRAIRDEKPRHNLTVALAPMLPWAAESRTDLVRRITQFKPTYSVQEVAHELGVGASQVKEWMSAGELGFMQLGRYRRVSGWQLIDFIETCLLGQKGRRPCENS
jgi:excisionase family DNA binding protein